MPSLAATGDAAEFRRFAALRNERAAHFPQIAAEEWKAETIEGMAETVCLRALRVLDPAQYAEALACYLAKLENELPLLFDARRLCYYTGTVLCLTLERLGLPFYNDFTGTTLYEQNRPTDALCFEAPEVPALAALFAEHLKEQQTTLAAHRQARPFHPCEAAICGYDPMNMFRLDQWLYCSHFLFIRQGWCCPAAPWPRIGAARPRQRLPHHRLLLIRLYFNKKAPQVFLQGSFLWGNAITALLGPPSTRPWALYFSRLHLHPAAE